MIAARLKAWFLPVLDPGAYLDHLIVDEAVNTLESDASRLLERLQWQLIQRLKLMDPGSRASFLKGQGLDFANLREYVPGDDIRKIDWNVFARTLTPHVREYHDEKQMTVWLVLDLTPSMQFGHRKRKAELAVELAGLLGTCAMKAGFKVASMVFDGVHREVIQPKAHQKHLQQMFQRILVQQDESANAPFSPEASFSALFEYTQELAHLVPKNAFVFFLSDFLSSSPGWENALSDLARHSLLTCVLIQDPVERDLPEGVGLLETFDPETGGVITIDCDNPDFCNRYAQWTAEYTERLIQQISLSGHVISTDTTVSPEQTIIELFQASSSRPLPRGGHR